MNAKRDLSQEILDSIKSINQYKGKKHHMEIPQLPSYKGYYGSINIDTQNHILYGKVESVTAVITYEANDAEGLVQAYHDAIDDYLAFCREKDITPEQPFKS